MQVLHNGNSSSRTRSLFFGLGVEVSLHKGSPALAFKTLSLIFQGDRTAV